LRLDANSYLLIGVPLTLFFQLVVKREPVQALWLREAPAFSIAPKFVAIMLALLIVPVFGLVKVVASHQAAPIVLWQIASILGAGAGAYALASFDKTSLVALAMTLATGGAAVIGIMLLAAIKLHVAFDRHAAITFGQSFMLYVPISFVLEEVTFRGTIDAFVQRPGESRGWASAFFVSSMWGLWHMPIVPNAGPGMAVVLVIWQCLLGVPLSFGWRKNGNLAVPAIVHALADAVRNAVTHT
jgi:hypothetical protein